MWAILFASALGWSIGFVVLLLLSSRKITRAAFGNSLLYLLLVSCLASANFELKIIEQKYASEFAFLVFRGDADYSNFLFMATINAVPFALTDVWWAAIGTNVAILAIIKAYLYDTKPRLSMIMWAPAVVNYGLFALRDPLIGLCFFALTIFLCRPPTRLVGHLHELSWAGATLLLRPEGIFIYLAARLMELRESIRHRPWLILLFPFIFVGVFYAGTYVPVALGMPGTTDVTNLPKTLQEFFQARAERNSNVADSSDILGGSLTSLPFVLRYPVQLAAFFVLPFPFEITSLPLALAFLDSLIFIALTVTFWRRAPRAAKVFLVVFVLAVAFFTDNYGNLLRLRFPAYLIIAGGLLSAYRGIPRLNHQPVGAETTRRT